MTDTFLLDENILHSALSGEVSKTNQDAQIIILSIASNGHSMCLSPEIMKKYWRILSPGGSVSPARFIVKVLAQLIVDSERCPIINPYGGRLPEGIHRKDEEFVRVAIARRPIFVTTDGRLVKQLKDTSLTESKKLRVVDLQLGKQLATSDDC